MKRIGIIGGIGPESTVDYYKLIIGAFHEKQADLGYPEIIIYSANVSSFMKIIEAKDWVGLTDWLVEKVISLHKAGAEFAAFLGSDGTSIKIFFLGCVLIAGLFGGATANRKILIVQAIPAAIGLGLVLLS